MPGPDADILHARVLHHLEVYDHHRHHHHHHYHRHHLEVHNVVVAWGVAVVVEHNQLPHVAELKIAKIFLNSR